MSDRKHRRRLRVVRFPVDPEKQPEQWHDLRKPDVTASELGALWGMHDYQTLRGLFAEKSGVDLGDDGNAMTERGNDLQPAVAKKFLRLNPGWKLRPAKVYLRAPELRLGATPDYFVVDPEGRRGVLEAKTVLPSVFKKQWTDDMCPMWITLQCLTQVMLARVEFGIVAAMVCDGFSFPLHSYPVPRHEAAERRIQEAVAQFWTDFDAGREPKIDFERDGPILDAVYRHHVAGKVLDLRGDNELPGVLEELDGVEDEIDTLAKRKEALKTQIKAKLGDAEGAMVNGWHVSWREQQRKEYTVKATSYRVLRHARLANSRSA